MCDCGENEQRGCNCAGDGCDGGCCEHEREEAKMPQYGREDAAPYPGEGNSVPEKEVLQFNGEPERLPFFCMPKKELIGAVAYCAYRMSPNQNPRNMEVVMIKLNEIIDRDFNVMSNGFVYKEFQGDFYDYIKDALMSIPEFIDWNRSQAEVDKGIDVNDPNRPPYMFVDRYTKEDWYTDFIDLDAFIRNVHRLLIATHDM